MAKDKIPLYRYCLAQAVLLLSTLLCCIVLLVLQTKCMNAKENDFVDSYCLIENRMRATVSFILAIMIFIFAESLVCAVKSFRTYKMNTGINEGVFIAMASGISYRIRAIVRTKWAFVIIAVFLLEVAPEFWQTISNYAISAQNVFVKNPGSTTQILNGNIDYGRGVKTLMNLQNTILPSAASLLPTVAVYSNPQLSKIVKGKVQTSVVRDTLVTNITSDQNKDDFSFTYNDTVATMATSCNTSRLEGVFFPDDGKSYVTKMSNNQGRAVSVNSSYTINKGNSNFITEKTFVFCVGTGKCNVTFTACETEISIAREEVIYVTNTKKVTPIRKINDNTTIDIRDLSELTKVVINAPEQVSYSFSSGSVGGFTGTSDDNATSAIGGLVETIINGLPRKIMGITGSIDTSSILVNYVLDAPLESGRSIGQGLFKFNIHNELHARVCSAVSLTLFNLLQVGYVPILGTEGSVSAYEELYSSFEDVDLYSVVLQAYMPTYFVWLLIVFFLVLISLFVIIDLLSFHMSPVNIKDTNELALIDNIGRSMASERGRYHLSNDTDAQEILAFQDHKMYVREEGSSPNKRIVIEYQDTHVGDIPNKSQKYV